MSTDHPDLPDSPAAERAARQRYILRTVWVTVPGTFAIIGLAFALLPPLEGMQEQTARLMLAIRWLLIAFLPYAIVCLWIVNARFVEGAHNPLAGGESERLKIHCRVLQNTLEQFVWFALCTLVVATYITAEQARLVPVFCVFFAFARIVYWWGYLRSGTLGRAAGVQITLSLNVALLAAALVLFLKHVAW